METLARILVVDDEPALLKMVAAFLGRIGREVETAGSTDAAWAKVEADPAGYAVAVLDATMPGMPMLELAQRILQSSPSVKIIVASGYPVDMSALSAAAPGRVTFLPKPFSPEMLATTVRRMLGEKEEV